MNRGISVIAALAAAALLAGCQTAAPRKPLYTSQQQAKSFGYSEKLVSPGLYQVQYIGPRTRVATYGDTHKSDVKNVKSAARDMARLRAADLALKKGFPAFKIEKVENDATVRREDYYPWGTSVGVGFGVGHGNFHGPFTGVGFGFGYPFYGGGYRADAVAKVTMTVRMLAEPGADGEDAAKVLAELRKHYGGEAAAAGNKAGAVPKKKPEGS